MPSPSGQTAFIDLRFAPGLSWLQSPPGMLAPWLASTYIVIHWVFLSLAVIFFLVSILCLLQAIKEVEWDTK